MTRLSHRQAHLIAGAMTEAQLARVLNRVGRYGAAFHDIRDAAAEAIADELEAIRFDRRPIDQEASDLADDLHALMRSK